MIYIYICIVCWHWCNLKFLGNCSWINGFIWYMENLVSLKLKYFLWFSGLACELIVSLSVLIMFFVFVLLYMLFNKRNLLLVLMGYSALWVVQCADFMLLWHPLFSWYYMIPGKYVSQVLLFFCCYTWPPSLSG